MNFTTLDLIRISTLVSKKVSDLEFQISDLLEFDESDAAASVSAIRDEYASLLEKVQKALKV